MKAFLGVLSLLVVLGVLSLLVKKQLPSDFTTGTTTPSQQVQQVKQQVEAALQLPRTNVDDK